MSKYKLGEVVYVASAPSFDVECIGRTLKVVEDLGHNWMTDTEIELAEIEPAEDVGYVFWVDGLAPDTSAPVVGNTKYNREIKPDVFVDVYDVLYAFKVTDPCLQHLIKKALAAGQRGHKDARQDLVDIRDSAQRALDSYDLWTKDA